MIRYSKNATKKTATHRSKYGIARTLPIKTANQRSIYRIARTLPIKTATLNSNWILFLESKYVGKNATNKNRYSKF